MKIFNFLLLFSTIMLNAKCKQVNSLQVKGAVVVCGTINGLEMGELTAYGSFVTTQTGQTVQIGDPIPFDLDTVPEVNMSHDPAPFTSVTINQSGVYSLFYKVRVADFIPIAIQVYINGSPLAAADDSGFTTALTGLIFPASAGDIVTLINRGPAPIVLDSFISGVSPVALTLLRIA